MPAPKISILVPVFNGEAFLAACLDSVLAQDFADCEILISDDGSTDDSPAIVAQYAARDRRIRWWKNDRNLGLAANFNHCLRSAKGEYIKFVLQDDLLLSPTVLRHLVELLEAHPEVSLAGSASEIIDATSRVIAQRRPFQPGIRNGRLLILQCLEQANLIGEPSLVLFRRAQATAGFDETLPQVLDLDLWFQLLEQGDFGYLAEPQCAFRQHAGQQTRVNRDKGVQDELLLIRKWYAKPWVQAGLTRQALFKQIYNLRRNSDPTAASLTGEMLQLLGRTWYVLFWLRWKLVRPAQKLKTRLERWRYAGPPAQERSVRT